MYYTIEPDFGSPTEMEDFPYYSVFKWGTHPEDSVLAGQESKTLVDEFDSLHQAIAEYPDAAVFDGPIPPHNTFDHLPSEPMSAYEEECYWNPYEYEEEE